jgi:hypothetical protein
MITLYWDNTERDIVSLQVQENDSSYRSRGLMQRPQLVLKFSLPTYREIPVGAYCTYQGETFRLMSPQNIKKQGTRNIEYTLTMGTYQDNMSLYKMRNTVDGRLKYSMCSTPAEFIAEIVANMNARDGANVWSVGDCIDTAPKTIEFNHTYCDAALSMVADEFETEWEIVNHAIHLHPVKYNENAPLPLSYGKGNGFVPGVGRTTPVGEQPIKRLYVQGGNRNIDRSTYGYPDLMLPFDQTLQFDGEKFEDETGFDSTKARTYKSDKQGYYIERIDESTDSSKEDSIDCSDRYPSRVGTVSSVVVVDASRNFYDFIDNSIPNDLNYTDCLIDGETMTVIFQTGMLAGKEFDVKYHHSERRFEIVPFEYDGITMPNNTWIPAVADTYAIFGCMLPQSYICDNNAKEGASWDMFRMAVRYLYANEDQKFTFSGKLQAMWSRANWQTISPKLVVGGYIHFSDTQFAPSGTDIRIIGIKDYLTDPYAPTIDISNGIVGQSVTTTLVQVGCQEVTIGEAHTDSINFTKRRFRDVIDTMQMLQESLLEFSEGINPITVQTMQALIGDASLQFVFTDDNDDIWPPYSVFVMNNSTKRLNVVNPSTANPQSPLLLKHSELASIIHPDPPQYMKWVMTTNSFNVAGYPDQGYYLYAKCSSVDGVGTGEFVLSATAIAMESVTGYYHFLVGILGKEYDGERSFVTLFGFTELLPGRVTTDLIISSDGLNYFDLVQGHIQANSAFIRGTIRSPFHNVAGEVAAYQKYDNLITHDRVDYNVLLRWHPDQSGRHITIVGGGHLMTPPSGMYYFKDGCNMTNGFSFGTVSLVGYGTETDFYGWIIDNYTPWGIDIVGDNEYFGSPFRVMAIGAYHVASGGGAVVRPTIRTFDGSEAEITKNSVGDYTLSVSGDWFAHTETFPKNIIVNALAAECIAVCTGMAYNSTDDTMDFSIYITQKGAAYDCSFNFLLFQYYQL